MALPAELLTLHSRPAMQAAGGFFQGEENVADTADRRAPTRLRSSELKRRLNGAQLSTLNTLERFGWDLKFIRSMPGAPDLVVLHDPDTRRFAVLDADGELDENPVWQKFRA